MLYDDIKKSAIEGLLSAGLSSSLHLRLVAQLIVRSLEAGFPIMDEQIHSIVDKYPNLQPQAVKEAMTRQGFFLNCSSCRHADYLSCPYFQRDLSKYCLAGLDDLVARINKAGMKGEPSLRERLASVRYHQKSWDVLPDGIVPIAASILEDRGTVQFEGDYDKMQQYKEMILPDVERYVKVKSAYGMWLTLEPTSGILTQKIREKGIEAKAVVLKRPAFGNARELWELCVGKLRSSGWKVRSRESEGLYEFNMTIVDGKHAMFFSRDNRTQELRGAGYTSDPFEVGRIEAEFDRVWRGPVTFMTRAKHEVKRVLGSPIQVLAKITSTVLGSLVGFWIGGPYSGLAGALVGYVLGHFIISLVLAAMQSLRD